MKAQKVKVKKKNELTKRDLFNREIKSNNSKF